MKNMSTRMELIFKVSVIVCLIFLLSSYDEAVPNPEIKSEWVKKKDPIREIKTDEKTKKKKVAIIGKKDPRYNVSVLLNTKERLLSLGWTSKEIDQAFKNCTDYVAKVKDWAKSEELKYNIPASITIAQGLLESDAGKGKLVTKTNNHFGLKCFSKDCKKGHCANYTDDSHKDFFLKFETDWESFRSHSLRLQNKRYKSLYKSNKFKYWAKGLQKAGYATSQSYAKKLNGINEALGLDKM